MNGGAFARVDGGYVLRLGSEEVALIARLLDELRTLLLRSGDAGGALVRLFPVVHPDDVEREAEYQRLMRDELVASRLAGILVVEAVIGAGEPGAGPEAGAGVSSGEPVVFDEERMLAFMQAVNAVRLVLGTMLDVSEDDSIDDDTGALAPEHHLYAFLSWILDSAVVALSPEFDL